MPVFQIEMLWDCSVCQATLNRGLERHCRNCGHAKDDRDREYMPDNVSIQDALDGDKRRRAEAGPDWKCKYCGSLQNPLNKCCTECGVPQGQDAKKAWDAKVEAATFDPTTGAKTSSGSYTEHVEPSAPAATSSVYEPPPRRDTPRAYVTDPIPRRRIKPGFIVAPCIVIVGVLLWFLFRTKIVDAQVSSVSWTHEVAIDRYQVFKHDGWDVPTGAFDVHDQGDKIHHYDHVKVGSHPETVTSSSKCGESCTTVKGECHTTKVTCTPNKNGTATCSGGDEVCAPDTKDCKPKTCDVSVDDYEDQPRYQHYYDWHVWEWHYDRTITHSGLTTEESWPSADELKPSHLNTGEREREGGRSLVHRVKFTCGSDSWDIEPKTCDEFERYPLGRHLKLKIGVAHGVEVLPP